MRALACRLEHGRRASAPEVTIAIPTRNRPALLREAITSALGQQSGRKIEVLVVDNGNPEVTRPVIAEFPDARLSYYVNNSDYGMVANWNQCLALASSPWVSILHDDDVLAPWFVEIACKFAIGSVAAVAVECYFGSRLPEQFVGVPATLDIYRFGRSDFLWRNLTPFPGVLINCSLAQGLGGFNPSDHPIADFSFWYALRAAGSVILIKNVGVLYRISEQQVTATVVRSTIRRTYFKRIRIGRDLGLGRAGARMIARYATERDYRDYRHRYKSLGESSYCEDKLLRRNSLRFVPGRLAKPLIRLIVGFVALICRPGSFGNGG